MRATGKSDPRSMVVTFQLLWGPRVTETLFGALMAGGGPSLGRSSRPRCEERAEAQYTGYLKVYGG